MTCGVHSWRIIVIAAGAQILAAIALRSMSLSAWRTRSARVRHVAQWLAGGADDEVVWAINATGRRLGRLSTCLTRALVAELLLATPDRPVTLTIGVRRPRAGALSAHAWITRNGRVVLGEMSERFVPLVEWRSPAP